MYLSLIHLFLDLLHAAGGELVPPGLPGPQVGGQGAPGETGGRGQASEPSRVVACRITCLYYLSN